MKKPLIFLIAILMVTAFSASAATFKVGDIYELKSGTVVDDIYIASGVVDITGDIVGDGIIIGGDISVVGDVTQDIIAVGGSVRLIGSVGDDARIVGGNISISSTIGDDLIAVGGFINILSDTIVSGDTVIAGGDVLIQGTLDGNLKVYADEVTINGIIQGDVVLKFTKKVTIGEDAVIAGSFTYSALEEVVIPQSARIEGSITRVESMMKEFEKKDVVRFIGFFLFAKLLLMLITGVLAVLVFARFSSTVGVQACDNFWKHVLVGFLALITVPIAIILLFMTFFGAYVGFFLLGTYILILFVSKVYAGIVTGALLSKWLKKKIIVDWRWAILGIIVFQALSFVPLFGGVAKLILVLATFGTLGTLLYRRFWLTR